MKYTISMQLEEQEIKSFECDSLPMLPNVGEKVMLITQDAPPWGVVRERRFLYQDGNATVSLVCDPVAWSEF